MMRQAEIVVFSHLRWDFVFQRPQHLLSRLARSRRVIFFEEPVFEKDCTPNLEIKQENENLVVVRPHTPVDAPGFAEEQIPVLKQLVAQLVDEQAIGHCIAWFYTPVALPLLDRLSHGLVVYDCMDALDAFLNAPALLKQREQELLGAADLVFTGGPSLFRRLEGRHAHAHCFPSSVDAKHFAQAKTRGIEPADQAGIASPRLGYFGVIDERIDLPLLDSLASARPDWQFVMVGPVVKISPESLPRRSNIHYLGQKSYAELPNYLSGWDVCLLPFARNESTRFISPTKTLEYMAAEKPIVSTSITDVVVPYGHIVRIEDEPARFAEACEAAINESEELRDRRVDQMREVLAATSWDNTAQQMETLMSVCIEAKLQHDASEKGDNLAQTSTWQDASHESQRDGGSLHVTGGSKISAQPATPASSNTHPVVVVGAGPTGLSAAYHLGKEALLIDQNDRVGGWCRSVERDGFTFDYAGHIMFSNDPYVHELYKTLLGDNVHWQDREAWVYSKKTFTRYPFQACLYGLPVDVIKECILGAIEARYGSTQEPAKSAPLPASPIPSSNGNGHSRLNGNGNASANGNGNASALKNGNGTPGSSAADSVIGLSKTASRLSAVANDRIPLASAKCLEGDVKDCCADGVLESTAQLVTPRSANGSGNGTAHSSVNGNGNGSGKANGQASGNGHANGHTSLPAGQPQNFEEFIYKVWGAGIAKHFAVPYNRKLWAVPLNEMETSWLGGRVPMPDLGEMIEGALQPVGKPMGPNARFGYPLRGGFQALMNGFLPYVQDRLVLGTKVVGVSPSARTITLDDGTVLGYEQLISTMPLPVLIRLMGDEAPEDVRQAANGLRHVSVRCVHLGIGREKLTEKHWIYYPEETVFHRIFVQGNASPHCNAPGGFGLTCEITYSPHKPLPCDGEELIQRCIDDCRSVGIITEADPVWTAMQVDMPFAYVVYDHARPKNVALIREWLKSQDVVLAGRYSEWEYYNSDHAFIAGKKAADAVMQLRAAASVDSAARSSSLTAATNG